MNYTSKIYSTKNYRILLESFYAESDKKIVSVRHNDFSGLCKKNCINYNNKYSCPPYSPDFSIYTLGSKKILVICFRIVLNQYAPLPIYHRIRAANVILKSLIDKELLSYKQEGFLVAGSGSCRACKPCGAKIGVPCKKPDRRIYSLEAMGVDVGALVKECFGFELQWYIKGKEPPEYTCVVGAVLS